MPGLRERKKAHTRRALSDAALQLAADQGLDGVTREAIATMAGVSLRTFNNYFSGKYEALAYRLTERMRFGIAAFRARPADEPLWSAIAEALAGTVEDDLRSSDGSSGDLPDRRELAEVRKLLLTPEVRNAVPRDLFDDWLAAVAQRTGTDPRRDMYPRLVVAVVRAVGDAAMDVYALDAEVLDAEAPSLPDLIRQGLAAVAAGLPEPRSGS